MKLMICLRGEPEDLPFLPEIADLGAGLELQSYGLVGIRSARDWETRFRLHKAMRGQFEGPIAVHGPFLGMEYAHLDHLMRDVVLRRLDMTFDVATQLGAGRVVLHTGYRTEIDHFHLQDDWLSRSVEFWQREIRRWAEAGIEIALENDVERSPEWTVRFVDQVDSPYLALCLDVGHQHLSSEMGAVEWVLRMGKRLVHVHLHDNDGSTDSHRPIGRGTIDFAPFYTALLQSVPEATLSLEVEDKMDVKMADLRALAARFA